MDNWGSTVPRFLPKFSSSGKQVHANFAKLNDMDLSWEWQMNSVCSHHRDMSQKYRKHLNSNSNFVIYTGPFILDVGLILYVEQKVFCSQKVTIKYDYDAAKWNLCRQV